MRTRSWDRIAHRRSVREMLAKATHRAPLLITSGSSHSSGSGDPAIEEWYPRPSVQAIPASVTQQTRDSPPPVDRGRSFQAMHSDRQVTSPQPTCAVRTTAMALRQMSFCSCSPKQGSIQARGEPPDRG